MKFAILLLATLATINFASAASPMGHTRSLGNNQRDGAYYPAVHTVVEEESDESNSSSEEEQKTKPKTRLTYRRSTGAGERRRRPQTRSWSRSEQQQVVEPENQQPRVVYDYGMYDRYQQQRRQLQQTREGDYVQYGNTLYPRYRGQVHQVTTPAPAPTRIPPRLMLKSGDNVHFGEGINWSIYRTDQGLTRVGTRDGEVVVRVVRPEYERPTTTEAPPPTTTPYQWNWQPCYTEQDCYRQYVNEYYRFYAHHQ